MGRGSRGNKGRNLVSQEARYQEKLSELSGQLAAREAEGNALRLEIEELKRELVAKSSGMDRLQAELASSNKEGECVMNTLRKIREDVTGFRHKNVELTEELQKKNEEIEALRVEKTKLEEERKKKEDDDSDEEEEEEESEDDDEDEGYEEKGRAKELESKVKELEGRIKDLEGKLREKEDKAGEVERERDRIAVEKAQLEAEREEEMKIVQEALDEAVDEKRAIQARFERDFEALRTVNTDREQQLLDDFEWKLREVEATCKRRLEERERVAEERLKKAREEADAVHKAQLQELATLKTHEAELAQLRGLTHELQRSQRQSARQLETLQVSEKILQEEASKLRKLLEREKNNSTTMEATYTKKVADTEKSWSNRLAALRNELNSSWEEKLRKELNRLRNELERQYNEEKRLLEEQAASKARADRKELEKKLNEAAEEISQMKSAMDSREVSFRRELEKAQANSDRDIFDLRRKLDKLDMSYQDQIEILNGRHHKEIEKMNLEAEQRVAAVEQTCQNQLSSTRTTLELVKEQMERDAQKKVEAVHDEYKVKLDTLWKKLTDDKEKAVLRVEKKFLEQLEALKEDMQRTNSNAQESEHLHKMVHTLKEELNSKSKVINDLQGNVDALQGGIQVLNEELNSQSKEMERQHLESENVLREREAKLEAQRQKDLEAMRKAHADEASKWRKEVQMMRDAFQRKAASLCTMLEDYRRKYEEREPRKEDVQLITDLRQALEEKEKDLSALTEEKRFYQLELAKHREGPNGSCGGPMEMVPARRRKGSKADFAQEGVISSTVRGGKSGRVDNQVVKEPEVNVCRGSSTGGVSSVQRTPAVPPRESTSVQPIAAARRGSSPALSMRPTGGIYRHPSIEAATAISDQLSNNNRSRSVDLAFFLPSAKPACALPTILPSLVNPSTNSQFTSNVRPELSTDTPLHITEPTPNSVNPDHRQVSLGPCVGPASPPEPTDPTPSIDSTPEHMDSTPQSFDPNPGLTESPLEPLGPPESVAASPRSSTPPRSAIVEESSPFGLSTPLQPLQIVEVPPESDNSSILNPPIPVLPDPTPPQ